LGHGVRAGRFKSSGPLPFSQRKKLALYISSTLELVSKLIYWRNRVPMYIGMVKAGAGHGPYGLQNWAILCLLSERPRKQCFAKSMQGCSYGPTSSNMDIPARIQIAGRTRWSQNTQASGSSVDIAEVSKITLAQSPHDTSSLVRLFLSNAWFSSSPTAFSACRNGSRARIGPKRSRSAGAFRLLTLWRVLFSWMVEPE